MTSAANSERNCCMSPLRDAAKKADAISIPRSFGMAKCGRAARTCSRVRLASCRHAAASRPIVSAISAKAGAKHVVQEKSGAFQRR
jgi:hypothetical protein